MECALVEHWWEKILIMFLKLGIFYELDDKIPSFFDSKNFGKEVVVSCGIYF